MQRVIFISLWLIDRISFYETINPEVSFVGSGAASWG